MQLEDCRISILFNQDGLHIEVRDNVAGIKFLDVRLNQEQTCQALSRMSHTECSAEVRGLDKVGKKQEYKHLIFPLSEDPGYDSKKRLDLARQDALKYCPEGWTPDNYYGSQDSFFRREEKLYAKTFIRRWV